MTTVEGLSVNLCDHNVPPFTSLSVSAVAEMTSSAGAAAVADAVGDDDFLAVADEVLDVELGVGVGASVDAFHGAHQISPMTTSNSTTAPLRRPTTSPLRLPDDELLTD